MIEMLKRLTSVSITFKILEHPNDLGVFYWGDKIAPFSGRRIEISKTLSQVQRIVILSHEIGHALCSEKKCKCFENLDITEREIHAHKYSLRLLLKHEQKEPLKWLINDINESSVKFDIWKKI